MPVNLFAHTLAVKSPRASAQLRTCLILSIGVFITGCTLPKLAINTQPASSYLLNPNTAKFCEAYPEEALKGSCQDLLQVAFYPSETRGIEKIYQQKISGANKAASLIKMMLEGEQIAYQPQQLADGNYRLPINEQTKTVWRALTRIHKLTYSIDDDF